MVKQAAHDSWDECSNHSGLNDPKDHIYYVLYKSIIYKYIKNYIIKSLVIALIERWSSAWHMLIVRFNCALHKLKSGVQVSIMIFFADPKVKVNPS